MDHPTIMSLREGRGELATVAEHRFRGQSPLPDDFCEGTAFDILHGDKRHAGVFCNFINGADVRMIQRRGRASLTTQTFFGSRFIGSLLRKKLQSYGAS